MTGLFNHVCCDIFTDLEYIIIIIIIIIIKRPLPNNSINPKKQCIILEPYVKVHALSASQKNKSNFEAFFILTNKTKLHFNLVLKA